MRGRALGDEVAIRVAFGSPLTSGWPTVEQLNRECGFAGNESLI